MGPSSDLLGRGAGFRKTLTDILMQRMIFLHVILGVFFQLCFPQEYEKYRHAFICGRTSSPDAAEGPWLARAILWGVQTEIHQDSLDGKGSICGLFNGGSKSYLPQNPRTDGLETVIVFPDLKIAFPWVLIFACLTPLQNA